MTEILDTDTTTTTIDTTQTAEGWMSPEGEFKDGAPENIKGLLEAKKWSNVNQLADAYLELEKFKGIGEHLVIPEAEDAAGWDNIYNKLGRPETHDKYEFSYDGDLAISDELVDLFKKHSHKLGKNQKQFEEDVKFQLDAVAAQAEAYEASLAVQKEEGIKGLKRKWGEANYETRVKEARITADKLGIYQTLEAKGLASDPDIISMLDTIVSRTAEGVITPSTPPTPTKSPQQELNELMKSEEFIKKFHPEHKKAHARFMELNQLVANTGQARQPRL